jgi:hypothetical protein
MNTHKIFKPSLMASQNIDSLVKTVVLDADCDNGTAVVIGAPTDTIFGETDANCFEADLTSTAADIVAIIDGDGNGTAEGYDVGLKDPRAFYNVAGYATRARVLQPFDEFVIENTAINGEYVAQTNIVVDTTVGQEGKFVLADAITGYAFAGEILAIDISIVVGNTYVGAGTLVRVVRNTPIADLVNP